MDAVTDASINKLLMVRHLLAASERKSDKRKERSVPRHTASDDLKNDQLILSGQTPVPDSSDPAESVSNLDIRLHDISAHLQQVIARAQAAPPPANAETQIAAALTHSEVQIQYEALPHGEALVVRDKNTAETERYWFEFQDGATFRIVDKWSGKSTTIHGDPHVDAPDQEDGSHGIVSDLKDGDLHTTFLLEDGTRVTFTALNRGVIRHVDIFHGACHIRGTGIGSLQDGAEDQLFAPHVGLDGASAAAGLPQGDTVQAGGNGTDWLDNSGNIIWSHMAARPVMPVQKDYAEENAPSAITATVDHAV